MYLKSVNWDDVTVSILVYNLKIENTRIKLIKIIQNEMQSKVFHLKEN